MERTIENLDSHISEALRVLKAARILAASRPTRENQQTVRECETDLNYLLDIKFEYIPQHPEESENRHG
jgi:hypothetical protein